MNRAEGRGRTVDKLSCFFEQDHPGLLAEGEAANGSGDLFLLSSSCFTSAAIITLDKVHRSTSCSPLFEERHATPQMKIVGRVFEEIVLRFAGKNCKNFVDRRFPPQVTFHL